MKLAIVTVSLTRSGGGVATAVKRLASRLAGPCDEVRLFSFLSTEEMDERGLQAEARLCLFKPRGSARFPFSQEMSRALLTWSPDIIHVHNLWQYPSVLARHAKRRLCVPTVVTPHGALQEGSLGVSKGRKLLAGWLFENRHLRAANCLHALSEAEAQGFRRYGLLNPVCVIPNGVDIPLALPDQAPPWGISVEKGRRIVLSIGRFHPVKGLPTVLRAWARMKVSVSDTASWALVLAGWDTNGCEAELRKLACELGLQRDVFFIGPVFEQQKQAALACADAVIVASISEGLPTTVLEGWAYAKPVLMTPACNLPVGFERCASIKIQPEVESITLGLQQLFAMSEADRVAMGLRGFALVRDHFTWERAENDLRAVYSWLLGTTPCPACVRIV